MQLFIIGDFFRRRRHPRANDEMPATPLLQVLLFWVSFGTAVLFGSLATTATVAGSFVLAAISVCIAVASLAAAVVLWRRLNR